MCSFVFHIHMFKMTSLRYTSTSALLCQSIAHDQSFSWSQACCFERRYRHQYRRRRRCSCCYWCCYCRCRTGFTESWSFVIVISFQLIFFCSLLLFSVFLLFVCSLCFPFILPFQFCVLVLV